MFKNTSVFYCACSVKQMKNARVCVTKQVHIIYTHAD